MASTYTKEQLQAEAVWLTRQYRKESHKRCRLNGWYVTISQRNSQITLVAQINTNHPDNTTGGIVEVTSAL